MKKINVGIIGTGNAAENHYNVLKKLKIFEVKSIYSKNKKRLDERKNNWNLKGYSNIDLMLKKENLEVVVICNENSLHYQSAYAAISSGCHVLIEKPIDANIKKTIKLFQLSKSKKNIVAVVMQKRFDKATNYLKKLITNRNFGKLISARVDVFMHRNNDYYNNQKWISNFNKTGGGVTIHHAIHSLDQAFYILNSKIKNLSYWTTNSNRGMRVEDTAGGWIKFKDNLVLNFNATVCAYPQLKNRIEIYGDKLAACLINDTIYKLPFENNGSLQILKKFKKSELGNYNDIWENFAKKILNNKIIPNLIGDVLITHKAIDALYRSAKQNKIINYK